MCDEIVTVVDNSIIVTGLVILVIIGHIKLGDLVQVLVSNTGQVNQVGTQLTKQDGAVCQSLQLCQDTSHRVDRIHSIVQVLILCIKHVIALLIEKVLARGEGCGNTATNHTCAEYFINLGNHNYLFSCFNIHFRLQVKLHTSHNATALRKTTQVDTLTKNT